MPSFGTSAWLAKQHHWPSCSPAPSWNTVFTWPQNTTLLFSSSRMGVPCQSCLLVFHFPVITHRMSPTVMKEIIHILWQSHNPIVRGSHRDWHRVTTSQGHRHKDKPILDPRDHYQAWDSARACPCLQVPPLASPSSLGWLEESGPTWVAFTPLCPHGAELCSLGQSQTVSKASGWKEGLHQCPMDILL